MSYLLGLFKALKAKKLVEKKMGIFSESELEQYSGNLETLFGNYSVIAIIDVSKEDGEKWADIRTAIEKSTGTVTILCVTHEIAENRFRSDEHLYYRIFADANHISYRISTAGDISEALIQQLRHEGYDLTEEFLAEIRLYNECVYPKADLKKEHYIKDLYYRIITGFFGSGESGNTIDERFVPFYKKEEKEVGDRTEEAESKEETVKKELPIKEPQPMEEKQPVAETISCEELSVLPDMDFQLYDEKEERTAKNVLLLSLSTLTKEYSLKNYQYDNKGTNGFVSGYYQLEPVPKMLAEILKDKKENLDYIIALATKETVENKSEVLLNESKEFRYIVEECTAEQFFKNRIAPFVCEDEQKERIKIIPIEKNGRDDNLEKAVIDTVSAIRGIGKDVHLYLDTHGGFRDFALVVQAIISLLDKDVTIEDIYSIRYGANSSVVSAKNEFEIFKFVSGMNELLNYGRFDSMKAFLDSIEDKESRNIDDKKGDAEFINLITDISEAIQLCDVGRFKRGLSQMARFFKANKKISNAYLSIFRDKIEEDYKPIIQSGLSESEETVHQIEWCLAKGLYQQALTLIESKMPDAINLLKTEKGEYLVTYKLKDTDGNPVPDTELKNHKKGIFDYVLPKISTENARINILRNQGRLGTKELSILDNSYTNYHYSRSRTDTNNIATIRFCSIGNEEMRINLVSLLYYHLALKQVRNHSNHADNKDLGISVEQVTDGIKEYMECYKKLAEVYLP